MALRSEIRKTRKFILSFLLLQQPRRAKRTQGTNAHLTHHHRQELVKILIWYGWYYVCENNRLIVCTCWKRELFRMMTSRTTRNVQPKYLDGIKHKSTQRATSHSLWDIPWKILYPQFSLPILLVFCCFFIRSKTEKWKFALVDMFVCQACYFKKHTRFATQKIH